MSDALHVVCPHCGAVNRSPASRLGEGPACGKCHQPLVAGQPVPLNPGTLQKLVGKGDLPVVVDFWAPWCGPCKMMGPAFAQAAGMLGPGVVLGKLNTEEHQALAAQYHIQSIPTMVLFAGGREVARVSGAMGAAQIADWVRSRL